MTERDKISVGNSSKRSSFPKIDKAGRRRKVKLLTSIGALTLLGCAGTAWIIGKAAIIDERLNNATSLIATLKEQVAANRPAEAAVTMQKIMDHTAAAKEAAGDPLWSLAASVPWIGQNFNAVAEMARSADDVATLGLAPLVGVFGSLDWNSLVPSSTGTDLIPLEEAAPTVASAAYAVRASADRLDQIQTSGLVREVADPLASVRKQLRSVTSDLDSAANASQVIPGMLGAEGPRHYLLMIQNNAEVRASGGIPGALAVLSFDKGKLSLGAHSSAGEVGTMSPPLAVDPEQRHIYSGRMGKFLQDVNLTPDFPTAAVAAQAMWERKTGQRLDGVISIDPTALSYILRATGPVEIANPELLALARNGLPRELTAENVVRTLLSDVYSSIELPELQDSFFTGVAQEVFLALSSGDTDAKELIGGLARAIEEGRILVWSALIEEQRVIAKYRLSGSISGPSVSPAQFGVYFNDGTGAKMDYHVKRTVQLVKECSIDGYEETSVRVTSTNTAPADAATSLPAYVTGDGVFGVPAGSVQTNIVAYGPVQAQIESAKVEGKRANFAPYFHSNRPVGVLAIRLAPGESKTVEYTFGKIVQHTEPNVVVTPTVQPVKEVVLPTTQTSCG